MVMKEEVVFLTIEEAKKMLPDRDMVSTFRKAGIGIYTYDWNKQDIIDTINKFIGTVQLSGNTATSIGYGIVLLDDSGYLFIETRQEGE